MKIGPAAVVPKPNTVPVPGPAAGQPPTAQPAVVVEQDDFGIDIFPPEELPPAPVIRPTVEPPAAKGEFAPVPAEVKPEASGSGRSRRRRGSRGRGRSGKPEDGASQQPPVEATAPKAAPAAPAAGQPQAAAGTEAAQTGPSRRRRRRRDRRPAQAGPPGGSGATAAPAPAGKTAPPPSPEPMDDFDEEETPTIGQGERVMLINAAEGEECRIAILHQGRLEELFIERASERSHVGNIYKGRVTNVEPSIQAAFVDFGLPKNGFLHISDLHPQYFPSGMRQTEDVGRKTPRRDRPPIQKCLRRGQEVIVQIIKEGIGTKGPTLTSYISIPGRYVVMMPWMSRLGVSRKIEDEEVRRKMRRVLEELSLPKDMGFILRTAGIDRTKRELQRDLNYLQRLWKVVEQRIKGERAPCELYQESDLVIRTIRDVYSSDYSKIIVDSQEVADKVHDFLAIAMPRSGAPVEVYPGPIPLFHKYGIETELENLHRREVPLPSGGSLVIDSTEAMVAIDVNSGRFREHSDAEETAFRINMMAAEEIARQLRLRDLGGLILCDFIDMRHDKHIRAVERAVREALRKHKERAKCLRISQFGIMEITRQRMRPALKRSIYQDCPYCHGTGMVKNADSMTLDVIRLLRVAVHQDQVQRVSVRVPPSVAFHLQNHKREALSRLEKDAGVQVIIHGDRHMGPDQYVFECVDRRGGVIKVIQSSEPRPGASLLARRQQETDTTRQAEGFETLDDMLD